MHVSMMDRGPAFSITLLCVIQDDLIWQKLKPELNVKGCHTVRIHTVEEIHTMIEQHIIDVVIVECCNEWREAVQKLELKTILPNAISILLSEDAMRDEALSLVKKGYFDWHIEKSLESFRLIALVKAAIKIQSGKREITHLLDKLEKEQEHFVQFKNQIEKKENDRIETLRQSLHMLTQSYQEVKKINEELKEEIIAHENAESALRLRDRAIESCVNSIAIVNINDENHPIEYVNPAFEKMTGYPMQEVRGKNCRFLQGDDRQQSEIATLRSAIQAHQDAHVVLRNYRKDGKLFWNDLYISPVRNVKGEVTHYVGIQNDITETIRYQKQLNFQGTHDALTDLPNRLLLEDRLRQMIRYAERHHHMVAVVFMDLDNFKFINNSYGHTVGDQLLQAVSARLQPLIRGTDCLARIGGDEFVFLFQDQSAIENISIMLHRILQSIVLPFHIDNKEIEVTCSMGFCFYPHDGTDIDILLRNADAAMYRAKENGKNNFQAFTQDMHQKIMERISIENSLRHALQRQELILYYQPKVALDSGKIVGAEALIRWQHPEKGLILPNQFIPLAEEVGLITEIGSWVIQEACRQNSIWQKQFSPHFQMSINLSIRQFKDKHLLSHIQSILQETLLPPNTIEFELTESIFMENVEESIHVIKALKALGIQLAIDDFGTGYSSLSYLQHSFIDTVKIDRSFVKEMKSQEKNDIINAIIVLAKALNMQIVAEGVENEMQFHLLKSLGCHIIQGYYISPPVSVDAFQKLLRSSSSLH